MAKIKEGYKATEIGVIPEEWGVKQLISVCGINTESLSSKTNPNTVINYIDIESVTTGRINAIKQMKFGESPSRARRKVQKEDVIVSTVRPYLKAFAPVERTETNLICSTGFAVLRANKNICDYEYLYQVTISEIFINQLITKMVGSNYPAVNSSDLANSYLPVPPLNEQHRIAEILSATDEHIEKLDKTIEDYQLLKKGMMKKLLTEGIGHTEFKDTEIGRIPKAWEVKPLKSITNDMYQGINTVTEKVQYFDTGIPIIQAKHMTKGCLDFSDIRFVSSFDYKKYSKKYNPQIGDLLISNIGTIGKVTIVNESIDFLIAWNVFLVKVSSNINSLYLSYVLKRLSDIGYYDKLTTGNATKFINKTEMGNVNIAIPTIDEQQQIASVLNEIDNRISLYQQEKESYFQLKKALMEKLLTGKIRVTL